MVRTRLALAALLLIAMTGTGCRHYCGQRCGLLARLKGRCATPQYEPASAPTFQPCCEGATGGQPFGYPGAAGPIPNVTDMGTMPGSPQLITPPGSVVPGDQARPLPADPSKGAEMSRTKSKANPF